MNFIAKISCYFERSVVWVCLCLCTSSYDKTLSDACTLLADKWSECTATDLSQFTPSDFDQFSAYQKKAFLSVLLQHVCCTAALYSSVTVFIFGFI